MPRSGKALTVSAPSQPPPNSKCMEFRGGARLSICFCWFSPFLHFKMGGCPKDRGAWWWNPNRCVTSVN